jgi:hypothetical protein
MTAATDDPELVRALWMAFPMQYFDRPGSGTIGGWSVIRGKGGISLWFTPDGGVLCRPGMPAFAEVASTMALLPDPFDSTTWLLLRNYLAERAGLDTSGGIGWTPKGREVIDRKRWSRGKELAGWTLRTVSSTRTIAVKETDPVYALLAAIQMTNCTCSTPGSVSTCPLHGTARSSPWF